MSYSLTAFFALFGSVLVKSFMQNVDEIDPRTQVETEGEKGGKGKNLFCATKRKREGEKE